MQKDRKKEHKKIIKDMRRFNKQLATDEYIGLNRFRVDLFSENWFRYSDVSGGWMNLVFKMSDKLTENEAFFMCNNHNYKWKVAEYANDFLIRCSDGWMGHIPPLHYVAYDIHTIIPYEGRKSDKHISPKNDVINTYSWIKGVKYDRRRI